MINLSLGTPAWHTQDDPLSQAVNQLSAKTGALFGIAAGNSGNSPYSVSAPGTADAALTVGTVNASDQLAEFSSAGPRMNDGGEGCHRSDSGTSMAAPHVAGAAVLLAQEHREWTGQQIKDALLSTSVLTSAYSPYQAGTGRPNVAAAYFRGQVIATGSADAGLVPWSSGRQREPVKRQITHTNTTDRPVTSHLSADRGASPAGVFTVSADDVTEPAHGTVTVGIVVNPEGLVPGQYAARSPQALRAVRCTRLWECPWNPRSTTSPPN
ncbi:S8 family serine peptidase (plasmid) [Streptomyces sp. NBC_01527]|uniref:S8 family serine peptidase n=1 Tax=unclassified Streptomyces TaxID=2593676 RepID=UPI002E0F2A3C|nr:S8 family serine peptidase [Streptomyces sp. NBC_01230]